jgi:ABC-type transport system involved in multi-copper enzyme maturation permease subunit
MGDSRSRAAAPDLLHYRPWTGTFRAPVRSVWPIARTALLMLFRRRLFWVLYALSMMLFLLFFFGQYLLAWLQTQMGEDRVHLAGLLVKPQDLVQIIAGTLKIDGSGETYRNYFWYQGYMVMIVLALAGSILIGNDLRFGSLPFYLSKPLSRWHYLLGKGLAVAVFINLMTTIPALILFVQYGLVYSYEHFWVNRHLVAGILGYGAVLTVSLTLILLATALWLRRTVPLIMTWTALFVLCRLLSSALVDGLHFDPRWRLIDLWNSLYLVGSVCLQMGPETLNPLAQPEWYEAALVLVGASLLCLSYLILRLRAVEIVR